MLPVQPGAEERDERQGQTPVAPSPVEHRTSPCPASEVIVRYYLHDVAKDQVEVIDQHLKECNKCRTKLASLVIAAEIAAIEDAPPT
jgi:hypothetical protein